MVRVTLPIIILAVVGYAFLIAMILLFLDKYLDLRVVAYTADASRQGTNLLHFILNSGCTDSVKEKLTLDLDRLASFSEGGWKTWEGCSNLEYDYNFSVNEIDGNSYKIVEKLVFNYTDTCYMSYQRIKGYVEMPVTVYNKWLMKEKIPTYRPAIAQLTMMKTPLSEMAFWISQASLRMDKKYDRELIKSIRVGPEVTQIGVSQDEINMKVDGVDVHKELFIGSQIVKVCIKEVKNNEILDPGSDITVPDFNCDEEYGIPYSRGLDPKCKIINIYANVTNNKIKIIIPVIS